MDILKQLLPFYRNHVELSINGIDESEFLYAEHSMRFCLIFEFVSKPIASASINYSELSMSLSSSMILSSLLCYVLYRVDNPIKSISQSVFTSEIESLFQHVPQPPIHTPAYSHYAQIADIPPILLCEPRVVSLFEE